MITSVPLLHQFVLKMGSNWG